MTGAGGGDGAHNETASMNRSDRRPLRRLSCSLSPVDVDLELSSVQHFLVQRWWRRGRQSGRRSEWSNQRSSGGDWLAKDKEDDDEVEVEDEQCCLKFENGTIALLWWSPPLNHLNNRIDSIRL